jgi:hypothetical protein
LKRADADNLKSTLWRFHRSEAVPIKSEQLRNEQMSEPWRQCGKTFSLGSPESVETIDSGSFSAPDFPELTAPLG